MAVLGRPGGRSWTGWRGGTWQSPAIRMNHCPIDVMAATICPVRSAKGWLAWQALIPLSVAPAPWAGTAKGSGAQEGGQQGLLGMQAIFSLVKHPAGRAFDRAGADLFAPVGRQAVQHDGAAVGFGQERLV